AADDGRQPAAGIVDAVAGRPLQPQPCFLHCILGLRLRAQHAVGDSAKASALGLETVGPDIFSTHRSHSFASWRQGHDERSRTDVTGLASVEAKIKARSQKMQSRMTNIVSVLPDVMAAMGALQGASRKTELPEKTAHLVHLRASQINGCGFCVDLHPRIMKKAGESDRRILSVAAWREAPFYTDAERAALALTEALTRIADREE